MKLVSGKKVGDPYIKTGTRPMCIGQRKECSFDLRDGFEIELMSRWECNSGHVLQGLFYASILPGDPASLPNNIECPYCHSAMELARAEGAMGLLDKVRDFIGEVSKHPEYGFDSSRALTDLGRLEVVIKKMAVEALRP